jgi:hypothetical protein
MRAIQYWLDNNKKNYIKPRPKVEKRPFSPVTKIYIDGEEQKLKK